jgi:hypothetical protein
MASTAASNTPVWPTYIERKKFKKKFNIIKSPSVIIAQTDHIRRGKIAHDEFMFALPEHFRNFIRDALCAHLRVLVVSGNLGRRDHMALLALELLLHASIKKECDMRVFLGFYVMRREFCVCGGVVKRRSTNLLCEPV